MSVWRVCIVAVAATLGAALLLAMAFPVHSHEALSGWHYPYSCCSDRVCREVAAAAILEGPEGYTTNCLFVLPRSF